MIQNPTPKNAQTKPTTNRHILTFEALHIAAGHVAGATVIPLPVCVERIELNAPPRARILSGHGFSVIFALKVAALGDNFHFKLGEIREKVLARFVINDGTFGDLRCKTLQSRADAHCLCAVRRVWWRAANVNIIFIIVYDVISQILMIKTFIDCNKVLETWFPADNHSLPVFS